MRARPPEPRPARPPWGYPAPTSEGQRRPQAHAHGPHQRFPRAVDDAAVAQADLEELHPPHAAALAGAAARCRPCPAPRSALRPPPPGPGPAPGRPPRPQPRPWASQPAPPPPVPQAEGRAQLAGTRPAARGVPRERGGLTGTGDGRDPCPLPVPACVAAGSPGVSPAPRPSTRTTPALQWGDLGRRPECQRPTPQTWAGRGGARSAGERVATRTDCCEGHLVERHCGGWARTRLESHGEIRPTSQTPEASAGRRGDSEFCPDRRFRGDWTRGVGKS